MHSINNPVCAHTHDATYTNYIMQWMLYNTHHIHVASKYKIYAYYMYICNMYIMYNMHALGVYYNIYLLYYKLQSKFRL